MAVGKAGTGRIRIWAAGLSLVLALTCGAAEADENENDAVSEVWLPASNLQQNLREDPVYIFDWEISRLLEEGIAYHREGELEGAVALYERCRRHDERRIEVLPYLALALDQQGRYDESLHYYEQYLQQEPEDDLVRFNCAAAAVHAGRFAQAVELAEPMLERCRREPLYTLLGVAHLHLGHREPALGYLKKAAELQPQQGKVYSNLGAAYLSWGDISAAGENLSRALQLAPDDGTVLNNAGAVLEAKGRRDLASAAFREAAKRGVICAEINELAVDCAMGRSDTMQAAQCADKYPQLGQARLLYVWALLEDDRPQEAAEELERWQREHGGDVSSRAYLGSIYYKMGRYEQALEQYRGLLDAAETPEAHYNASLCLTKLGRDAEAEREARSAYDMSDGRPEIIYNLARCCEAVRDYGGAVRMYRRLAAEYPNFIDPGKLERHCRRLSESAS